jgi:hypothetical protein
MIGETTLAMLYVPVFFYLLERFTQWQERRQAARGAVVPAQAPDAAVASREDPGAAPAPDEPPP